MRKIIAAVALALSGLTLAAPAQAGVGDTTRDGGTVLTKTLLGCSAVRCYQERTVAYDGTLGPLVATERRSYPTNTRTPLPGRHHAPGTRWHVVSVMRSR